jgi:hypothetical protein
MDFVRHCIKRNPYKLEGRATAGMLIILLILSLLGWIYLTQASHVATTSRRNQELEAEVDRLQQGNLELIEQIAEYESVSRLAAKAKELGFVAVTPSEAGFLAVAAPAPGVPLSPDSGAQDSAAQARVADRESALGVVKFQFTAWARANGVRSARSGSATQ